MITVVKDEKLTLLTGERRYVVVDKENGNVLDDAQGYGYKTTRNAYAAYAYKHSRKQQKK